MNDKEKVKFLMKNCLHMIYKQDSSLIDREPNNKDLCDSSGTHVCERAIVYRFAHYFENMITSLGWFKYKNIDVEYNRDYFNMKTLMEYPNGTFPDMILHKRLSNKSNILVLEFKAYWNADVESDITKVQGFIKEHYGYKFGAVIRINQSTADIWLYEKK